jgi:Cas10/Cmr2, second palm domain
MNRVRIDLQRVQTWLFAVPRLRAMVGANALLGEVLRVCLPELARKQSSWQLAEGAGGYPSALADDPLSGQDDPASDARDGILSRDGGHFEATFASGAPEFIKVASALLRRELPGIRFRVWLDEEEQSAAGVVSVGLSTELPVLAPCEWTGRGLGSLIILQGTERNWVSLDVSRRHKAAKRAEEGKAQDLASLLVATTSLKNLSQASDFDGLAGAGYLALVHADGNGVGSAAKKLGDIERAAFFHRNRVLLRRALQRAIDVVCEEPSAEDAKVAPLQPLMLGGDDLLVVCGAQTALPFVVALCQGLTQFQRDERSPFKLTLGVGVVFARPTVPIHRLHEVAEQLAASAKRRFRGFSEGERRSVVDWAVYTTARVDNPEEVRQRDWVRGAGNDRRVLSRRPVDVLGDGLDSLQGLLGAADKLKGALRSQLRYLVEQLPRGRALSELAFAELSHEARKTLKNAGIMEIWTGTNSGPLLTSVLDLIEISEIGRLGRAGTITEPIIEEGSGGAARVGT